MWGADVLYMNELLRQYSGCAPDWQGGQCVPLDQLLPGELTSAAYAGEPVACAGKLDVECFRSSHRKWEVHG